MTVGPRPERPPSVPTEAPDYDYAAELLSYIPNPSADRELWLTMGMSLHSTGADWACDLWDTWSQQYPEKYNASDQQKAWDSFSVEGPAGKAPITFGTLVHLARQHGYQPPRLRGSPGQQRPLGQAPAAPAPDLRPDISLNTEMTRIVDEGQAALLGLPGAPILFQRARQLCVMATGVPPPKWLHRPQDMPVILDASVAHLTELATRAARWWQWAKREQDWVEVLPPKWFVPTLQGRPGWPFPVLEGIVSSPTLRPDGSLLTQPGYDASTGLYLDLNSTAYPEVPALPTLAEARTAIGCLQEPLKDFPFTEEWHFSAALAAILSLVCRFAIRGNVPLFAIRANTRGSGKSLQADVLSIIGTGRAAPRWPQVTEDEEERKRLLTVALAGYPCIHIDNVTKPLGSPALDLAHTAPSFSDRILGKHDSREAPLNMIWLASGNNMQFKGDTARRIVPIDLDPKMEKPEERTGFVHNPLLPWVQRERPRLTVAALTIVKAYFEAGCPSQGLAPMGSFEQWSDLVRQALVWAGEADPNEGRKDLEAESDPEYERLAGLLEAWIACYPIAQGKARSQAKTLHEVMADIATLKMMDKPAVVPNTPNTPNEYDALQDALGAFDTRYDGKGLRSGPIGNRLRFIQGRMIGTKRLTTMGKGGANKTLWGIEAF
jgi:putative DNA primase/helicase